MAIAAIAPSKRFLDREVDAFRSRLAESDVETQIGFRSFVDRRAKPGASAGREAVENLLAVFKVRRGRGIDEHHHSQQAVAHQRAAVFDLAVGQPLASKL